MAIPVNAVPPTMNLPMDNPYLKGMGLGQDLYAGLLKNISQQMQNQEMAAKLPYVGPTAEAELKHKQAMAPYVEAQTKEIMEKVPWIGKEAASKIAYQNALASAIPSEIALRQAQAGHYGAETEKLNWMLKHPGAMYGGEAGLLEYLQGLGGANIPTPQQTNIQNQNASTVNQAAPIQSQQSNPELTGNALGIKTNNPLINNFLANKYPSPEHEADLKAYQQGLISEKQLQNKENMRVLKESINDATQARKTEQFIDQFENNYKKSFYKGRLGTMPSKGFFAPPGSGEHEQLADQASENMQAEIAKLLGGSRSTNYELKFSGPLKLSRNMDPKAVEHASEFLKAKLNRIKSEPDFIRAAKEKGIDANTAQLLFKLYDEQLPSYDFMRNQSNTQFNRKWDRYLNIDAINAVKNGQIYVPEDITDAELEYLSPEELMFVKKRQKARNK